MDRFLLRRMHSVLFPFHLTINHIVEKTLQLSPINLLSVIRVFYYQLMHKRIALKGKAVPLQAWSGPEGSRKLSFPDYVTTAQDGGKVVSLTHRPLFTPRKYSWYSFLLEAESTPGS